MSFNYKKHTRKIFLFYLIIPIIIAFVFYPLLPTLLDYPPESINNQFQIEFDGITYTQQYMLLVAIMIVLDLLFLYFRIHRINKNMKSLTQMEHLTAKEKVKLLSTVRSLCLKTPYILYYLEISIPLIFLPITFILIKAYLLTIIKICIVYVSFFTLGAVLSFVSSQSEFKKISIELHHEYPMLTDEIEEKAHHTNRFTKSLHMKLTLQILPLVMISLVFTSLIGYTQAAKKSGDIYYLTYTSLLNSASAGKVYDSVQDIEEVLKSVNLLDTEHKYFILNTDKTYLTSDHTELQPFFIKYTLENSPLYQGRTYDYFCLDIEGIAHSFVTTDGTTYYAGFTYSTGQPAFLQFILISDCILLFIVLITLTYISTSLSKDISVVTNSLDAIAKDNENKISLNNTLAVTSEDEIRNLSIAFNKVQKMTKNNVENLQNKQDLLMEKERLASLGQLIGGIAHNLKTPIMSISGASEGLTDLVSEYNSSIGDPEVNETDHHAIANDMSEWIEKIKTHASYMSDVITAVKGQAVVLSEEEQDSFSIEELIKRVNILMKHELNNALIDLNIMEHSNSNILLNGNVNSLVQVINNMVSNSIQAYTGKLNKVIDLSVTKENNKIIITIQDYGCGMTKEVKEKLFKEMITTKGKNGTGLGLFMSYSTIRAHFNGTITFTSEEGKGTKFNIILPL